MIQNFLYLIKGRTDVQYSGKAQAQIQEKKCSRPMLFDIHHFYVILLYKRINEDKNIKTTNRLLMREVPFPSLCLLKNKMTEGQLETVKSGKSLKL